MNRAASFAIMSAAYAACTVLELSRLTVVGVGGAAVTGLNRLTRLADDRIYRSMLTDPELVALDHETDRLTDLY